MSSIIIVYEHVNFQELNFIFANFAQKLVFFCGLDTMSGFLP